MDLVDSSELKALMAVRLVNVDGGDADELRLGTAHSAVIKSDARRNTAMAASPITTNIMNMLRMGLMPSTMDVARLAEATRAAALGGALDMSIRGLPALGIRGVQLVARTLTAECLEGVAEVFVSREPSGAGLTFVRNVSRRLEELGYPGKAWVFDCGSAKDPNELLQRSADFRGAMEGRLEAGRVLPAPHEVLPPTEYTARQVAMACLRDAPQPHVFADALGALEPGWWLLFHRDTFWRYNGRHYAECPVAELRAHVVGFIRGRKWLMPNDEIKAAVPSTSFVGNVLLNLQARVGPTATDPPVATTRRRSS